MLFENGIAMTSFKRPTFVERIVVSPLMRTKYLTSGYRVTGEKHTPESQIFDHIIVFLKPLPSPIRDARGEHFPLSLPLHESII